jgi:hypothetical protein
LAECLERGDCLVQFVPCPIGDRSLQIEEINASPSAETVKLTTNGSEEAEAWLDHYLRGLSEYLSRTLGRLVALPDLKLHTTREVLTLAKQHTLFVLYD